MPIQIGTDSMGNAMVGDKQLASIWFGDTLRWQNIIQLTLNSAELIVLETWIASQGNYAGKKIRVTIPAGEIIGTTNTALYALRTGNLSIYKSVELVIDGEIQGAGGDPSGGAGGGAMQITPDVGPNFAVVLNGALRAGGGAGSNGATISGYWNYTWHSGWTALTDSGGRHTHGWGTYPQMSTWWNNIAYNVQDNDGRTEWVANGPAGANTVWQRGAHHEFHWYYIRYGSRSWVAGKAGGTGGYGQGYQQARTDGQIVSGNNGGNGGTWGTQGQAGQGGTSGGATNYALHGVSYGSSYTNNGVVNGWVGG